MPMPQLCSQELLSTRDMLVLVPMALQMILELGGLGAFFVALASEIQGRASGRAFPDRLARQMTVLGVWLLAYTLFAGGAVLLWLVLRHPALMDPWLLNPMTAAPLVGLLTWITGFALAYLTTWRSLSERPALHIMLGAYAAAGVAGLLFYGLAMKTLALGLAPGQGVVGLADILAVAAPGSATGLVFWTMLALSLLLALACAGALGLIRLLMRRGRDDFGRDYYNFAAPACARWAAWCTLGALAAAGALGAAVWPWVAPSASAGLVAALACGGAALMLLACLAWLGLARSDAPMRQKPGMLLGMAAFWLGLAGLMAAMAQALLLP